LLLSFICLNDSIADHLSKTGMDGPKDLESWPTATLQQAIAAPAHFSAKKALKK